MCKQLVVVWLRWSAMWVSAGWIITNCCWMRPCGVIDACIRLEAAKYQFQRGYGEKIENCYTHTDWLHKKLPPYCIWICDLTDHSAAYALCKYIIHFDMRRRRWFWCTSLEIGSHSCVSISDVLLSPLQYRYLKIGLYGSRHANYPQPQRWINIIVSQNGIRPICELRKLIVGMLGNSC